MLTLSNLLLIRLILDINLNTISKLIAINILSNNEEHGLGIILKHGKCKPDELIEYEVQLQKFAIAA